MGASSWRSSLTQSATAPLVGTRQFDAEDERDGNAAVDTGDEVADATGDEDPAANVAVEVLAAEKSGPEQLQQLYTWGITGIGAGKTPTPVRLPSLQMGERVQSVACGAYHCILITSLRRCFSWGKVVMALNHLNRS